MQSMIPAAERYNLRGGNERKKRETGKKSFYAFLFRFSLFVFIFFYSGHVDSKSTFSQFSIHGSIIRLSWVISFSIE